MTEHIEVEQTEFKFEELDQHAKDKAIAAYADPGYNWWDIIYDNYKNDPELIGKGFSIAEINFSGFYSQGDGACWRGNVQIPEFVTEYYTDPEQQVLREALLALVYNGDISGCVKIKADGRYSHEYTMTSEEPEIYAAHSDEERIPYTYHGIFAGASVCTLIEMVEPHLTALSDHILEEARNIACRIYEDLESEYDGYFEEESFAYHCEANDWLFDEDGKLV